MRTERLAMETRPQPEEHEAHLGLGWSASLEARRGGALLRVSHPEQRGLLLEIAITVDGPVVRAFGAALELSSLGEIKARCERFTIEASQRIALKAPEITQQASEYLRAEGRTVEVDATAGDVLIHANDDVQVLGEQVLLNCDREPERPAWIPRPEPETTLPRQDVLGDPSLVERHDED